MFWPDESDDGSLYVAGGGTLYALDPDNGSEQFWMSGASSSPAVVDGTVYVGSHGYDAYALAADDGSERWSYRTGFDVDATLAVADGRAYVGSVDGGLYALSGTTPKPASFAVSTLTPTAVTTTTGETLSVSATVENTGFWTATKAVEFRVDGSTVTNRSVTLDRGRNTTVAFDFNTSGYTPGQYTYTVSTADSESNGTLTVQSAFDVVGNTSAQDPDGDGRYEDVNGDGQTDVFDAITYYNNRNSDTIRNNTVQFDFDGDGTAGTVFDAIELYNGL